MERSPGPCDPGERMRSERWVAVGIALALLAASVCIVFSNWFDWDYVLGFHEAERRSWVLDGEPPLWSYQLCSGVTRIGDPQSFGLSPLFAVVLAFGSFWGSKLAVIASIGLGLHFAAQLFGLFARAPGEPRPPRASLYTLGALFVASNFFLWHLLVGHLTFLSFYFGLGIAFYTLKGFLYGLRRDELAVGALLAWQHYSGGFIQSAAYLLLPFFLAFAAYAALCRVPRFGRRLPGTRAWWRRLAGAGAFHVLGALLACYKLLAAWRHQQAFPRRPAERPELIDPIQLLGHQLVPTWRGEWLLPLDQSRMWALHEYSAFSLFPFLLLVAGGRLAWARLRRGTPSGSRPPRHPLAPFVGIYLLISCAFVSGDFAELAPFRVVNRLLFSGGLQVVGRYGVDVTLCLALASVLALRRLGPTWLAPTTCLVLLGALILNVASFSWMLSPSRSAELWSLPAQGDGRMRISRWIRLFPPGSRLRQGNELFEENTSQMYPAVRAGEGVINCYKPLAHPTISGWPPERADQPLIDPRFGPTGARCLEESHFTQNHVRIAASCADPTCVGLAWVNDRDRAASGLEYDRTRRHFCRGAPLTRFRRVDP